MASFTTTLSTTQQIAGVIPNATGIDAPTVSSDALLEDSFPSNADPIPVSFTHIDILGSRFRKSLGGKKTVGIGDQYFNDIYVLPVSIDAGTILSVIVIPVEVYSSYLIGTVAWTAYDDSAAGVGVSLADLDPPPPDINLAPQSGSNHELTIDTVGPPSISADIIYTFTDPALAAVIRLVPITGTRSVIFSYQPEAPLVETLVWSTEISRSSNGEEQRFSLRDVPRSIHKMSFRNEGKDIRTIENVLFAGQARQFGIPVWFQATQLTAAITITDTVITVTDTTFLDLVVDNLIVVWSESDSFEALPISSFTSTTITVSSEFRGAFSVGALVMPVLIASILTSIRNQRHRVGPEDYSIDFVIEDNGESLASTTAFNSYTPTDGQTRVLLDDGNFVDDATISEEFRRQIVAVDNTTAAPIVFTDQGVSREVSQKGFFTKTSLELQNVRKLLHALRGRQVSFYLPSFAKDLEPFTDISSSEQALTIVDVDYVNDVAQQQPRNVIRVVGTDGTVSDPKLVTGSSKPAVGQESLSLGTDTIGVTIALADIERIEYVKKTRINTDRIDIRHLDSNGKAAIIFPVITVLEGDA